MDVFVARIALNGCHYAGFQYPTVQKGFL